MAKKKQLKVKKKIIFIFFIFAVFIIGVFGIISLLDSNDKKKNKTIYAIKYNFIKYGRVKDMAYIYTKDGNKYKRVGLVGKNFVLEFERLDNNYLKVKGFDREYYIKFENVEGEDGVKEIDQRYKKYIMFNENIVTDNRTSFYDEDGNFLYTINNSYDFPIIVKDDERYGVEFNNSLVYIKKDNVKEVRENHNTDEVNASGVGVLNYHFFYDDSNAEETAKCNQEICVSKTQFQSELDYLKENKIFTITTEELNWYIDSKINLPKSVLITIDDGWMMELGLQMLEENKMNGCMFLITSWFENTYFRNNYKYIEFQSHGEKLHNTGVCPGGQGGAIKCLSKEQLLSDLRTSQDKLGGSTVIAYPFYEYNDYSIRVLKEAGFTMAFAGETAGSDNLVHVGSNKYELPRFVMVNYTTKSNLDRYFSNIY